MARLHIFLITINVMLSSAVIASINKRKRQAMNYLISHEAFWTVRELYKSTVEAMYNSQKGNCTLCIVSKTYIIHRRFLDSVILLSLSLLTSTKWWAPNNASKWRMGFNSAFKGLKEFYQCPVS